MEGLMDDLIPLVAIISIFALPIIAGIVLGLRAMKNRNDERMGLINQGIIPPNNSKKRSEPNKMDSLRNGIVLVSLGIGIVVGFLCSEYLVIGQGNEFWITASSVVFFLGAGYLAYFFISEKYFLKKQEEDEEEQEQEQE